MEDMTLYDKLREVPEDAKKPIRGGKLSGFTDINPMWRIEKLTEVFGPCGFGWWYEIKDQRLKEGAGGEIKAFVDIDLYVKDGNEVSKPIPGIGGSSFIAIEKGKPVTSDECFKMALTDAIGVAAKALGLGADVYRGCDKDKYNYMGEPEQPQQNQRNQLPPLPQARTQGQQRGYSAPPDVRPEPFEAEDGYYYCSDCKEMINGTTLANGQKLSPKDVAVLGMQNFGTQLCYNCGARRMRERQSG